MKQTGQAEHADKLGKAPDAVKKSEPRIKVRPRKVTIKGSVYKYWSVDLGNIDGKRKVRTFKTKAEAESAAEAITKRHRRIGQDAYRLTEGQLKDAAEAFIILDGKARLSDAVAFYARYGANGAESSTAAAVEYFRKHGAGDAGEIRVADLVARFMERGKNKNLRQKTLKDQENRLKSFVAKHGQRMAHQITLSDVEKYLATFKGMVNRDNHRRVISSMFNFAIKRRYAQVNPVDAIEPPKKDAKIVRVLSVEQTQAVMQAAQGINPKMVPYFAIALFAGLRPEAEIMRLDWSRINFRSRVIDVPGAYSKIRNKSRNVQMEDNLVEWLTPHRQEAGPIYYSRRNYDEIRRVAGVDAKSKAWSIDIMRHSYGSYHFENFKSLSLTAKNMGDNEKTVEKHYVNRVEPEAAAKYWQIKPVEGSNLVPFKATA